MTFVANAWPRAEICMLAVISVMLELSSRAYLNFYCAFVAKMKAAYTKWSHFIVVKNPVK